MRPRSITPLIFVSIVCSLFAGCATTDSGLLARQWSRTIRQLDINPIFPPRENIYVGDVYLPPAPPGSPIAKKSLAATGYVPIGAWLAYIDLTPPVVQLYKTRPAFAPTPSSTAADVKKLPKAPFEMIPIPRDEPRNNDNGHGGTFGEIDLGRLREVGFPSFFSLTVSKGNISGLIPAEAMPVIFNGAFGSEAFVRLSVPIAESYGVPESVIISHALEPDADHNNVPMLSPSVLGFTKLGVSNFHVFIPKGQGGPDADALYVTIISQVYYTRAIDLSISRGVSQGAAIIVGASHSTNEKIPTKSKESHAAGASGGPASSCGVTHTSLASIQRQLQNASARSAPGGTLTVLSCSDSAITLRRTYQEPIAIGYRGITLKLDPTTLDLKGGSPTNTVLPERLGGSAT